MLSICNTNLLCFTPLTKPFKICGLHGHREPLNHTGVIGPFLFVDTSCWFPADLVTPTTVCSFYQVRRVARHCSGLNRDLRFSAIRID
jgi:hypothetical protein